MKLVIFDCDGTLVDSQHIIVTAMSQAFAACGLPAPPREKVLAIVGLSLPVAVERLLPQAVPGAIAAVGGAYKEAFGELRRDPAHNEPMFPGIMETLRELARRRDVVLGVATGKSSRGVASLFDRFGIGPHFVTIQTADSHPSKPHPSMIFGAMSEAGVEAADTVMIGDTTYDVEMARAARVGAIGVGWGYHPVVALEGAGAHVIVARGHELVGAIEALFQPGGAVR